MDYCQFRDVNQYFFDDSTFNNILIVRNMSKVIQKRSKE